MPFGLGFFATAGVSAAGSFDLLETQTLTGSQASVTFSNLNTSYGSTYQHLQLRIVTSHTGAGGNNLRLRFNADTGNNYSYHELIGNGSNVTSGNAPSQSSVLMVVALRQNLSNNSFGAGVVDILDPFETTKNKTVRALSGHASTESIVSLTSGARLNTEAITSITLLMGSGDIGAKSRYSLYGIKAA